MNFESFNTLSGQSGNITRKGRCNPAAGDSFNCIEKTYANKNLNELHNAKAFLEYLAAVAPEIAPRVYHTTHNTIYMEFISHTTLRGYIEPLDLTIPADRVKFETAVLSVKKMLTRLSSLLLCHKDLHADNIIMCADGGAKVIDLDGMKLLSEGRDGGCDDVIRLAMYIKSVGRASLRRAGSSNKAMLEFVDRVSAFDSFNPQKFHTRPQANIREMTASSEEFNLIN